MDELSNFREFLNAEVVTLDELNVDMEQWTVADVMELKTMIARTADYIQRADRAKSRLGKMFDKFENKVQGKGLKNAYQLKGTEHMKGVVDMMFPDNAQTENETE